MIAYDCVVWVFVTRRRMLTPRDGPRDAPAVRGRRAS